MTEYARPDGQAEIREFARVMAQSFAGPPDAFQEWVSAFGPEDVRVMRGRGIEGGLVLYRMGQFFGGRAVPIWGVAGVSVAPESRGRGLARELMLANLREHFEHGPPLSTLWPATTRLYRALGWETGGTRNTYRVRCADLPREDAPGKDVDASMRPAGEEDDALIRELYAQRHTRANGCLDRCDAIWKRVARAPGGTPVYRYIIECDGRPEGYITYTQRRENDTDYVYSIILADYALLSAHAARKVVATLAAHRSVARDVQFHGAPGEALLMRVLNSQKVRVHDRLDWMLRVVRVGDALEARGYPDAVHGEASLEIIDGQVPENNGPWNLRIEGGRAEVKQGGDADTRLDIRGLAALFTGRLPPHELRMAGLMTGNEAHDDLLQAAFAGPAPWMPDFF